MYIPKHFQFTDREAQLAFIQQFNFADLVVYYNNKLEINQFPFLLTSDGKYLLTHLAKSNEQWKALENADAIVVNFRGPNAYISPNWYIDTEKNVPTWNFLNVQVSGKASILTEDELYDLLDQLSQKHEADIATPWRINKLSDKRLKSMMKAIVGVKISIDAIQGKAKLSQNKSQGDIEQLVASLKLRSDNNSAEIAEWIKQANLE